MKSKSFQGLLLLQPHRILKRILKYYHLVNNQNDQFLKMSLTSRIEKKICWFSCLHLKIMIFKKIFGVVFKSIYHLEFRVISR